ncbi:zinc finger-containing ubiquitin peptidase 1-like [Tubulanus polymorphus]|uniref:zinc finger-containing ubiquitin peptidase 1-like n=1 Tax=Tubulanus polymorphus TaxID=672921 RepID=UPI003DA45587
MAEGGVLFFTCDICGQEGLSENDMKTHVLIEHVEGAITCPFCDIEGSTSEEMNMHINAEHLDVLSPTKTEINGPLAPALPNRKSSFNPRKNSGDEVNGMHVDDNNSLDLDPSPSSSECSLELVHSSSSSSRLSDEEQVKKRAKLRLNVTINSPRKTKCDTVQSAFTEMRKSARKDIQIVNVLDEPDDNANSDMVEVYSCPLCVWTTTNEDEITRHVNVQHLDLLSPALKNNNRTVNGVRYDSENNVIAEDPDAPVQFICPICGLLADCALTLEVHVNTKHLEILSPDSAQVTASNSMVNHEEMSEDAVHQCPVCGMEDFDPYTLTTHVEGHFSAANTPAPEAADNIVAQELERREKMAAQHQEQKEFDKLQAMYGMDNKTDFVKQTEKNLERAVVRGDMSISDYYAKKLDIQQANTLGVDDGHSCTKGITVKLREFYQNNNSVHQWWLCSDLDHYASTYGDKGWGCGYRNVQMLLSSLAMHRSYRLVLFNGRPMIPSIPKIQRLIEAAWQKGFDLQGCEQLGGKVVDTNKWIGATEVVATLASLKIKCQLVDFHAPTNQDGTHPRMFEWVRDYFKIASDFKPPLYLQHHGHSRTIIGAEQARDGSIKLLIFDPIYTHKQMQQFMGMINNNMMRTMRRSLNSMKAKQYQIVAARGILSDTEYEESKIIKSDRIPA